MLAPFRTRRNIQFAIYENENAGTLKKKKRKKKKRGRKEEIVINVIISKY